METALNPLIDPGPPDAAEGLREPDSAVTTGEKSSALEGATVEDAGIRNVPGSAGTSALVRSIPARVGVDLGQQRAPLPEHLQQIQFRLELCVPLPGFTLRQLRDLQPNALLETEHSSARDLVLTAAGERLLLVELEAVELQLAARVKRLL